MSTKIPTKVPTSLPNKSGPGADVGKRRLSSDGQTPKPTPKQVKMATNSSPNSSPNTPGKSGRSNISNADYETFVEKMTIIADAVDKLQKGQSTLQSIVESKLDKFRNEFVQGIDEKFKAMKSDIDLEFSIHKNKIDTLSQTIDSIMERLELVENGDRPIYESGALGVVHNPLEDTNITIIATNVKFEPSEDILSVAKELVAHLDDSAQVVAAARLKNRKINKPGLVKISFARVDQKIRVLRAKRKLAEISGYRSVFLRSSKTHTERLIELNARTILNEMPNGKDFRITANGRIVKKIDNQPSIRDESSV